MHIRPGEEPLGQSARQLGPRSSCSLRQHRALGIQTIRQAQMAHPVSPLAPKTYPDLPKIAGVRFATAEAAAQVRSQLLPTISCVWAVVDLREPRRAEDLLPQDVAQALAHDLPLTVEHDTGRPAAR